ncbi:MAG: nitrile hydratase accessory protein [Pseudomonadota bacterium]
MSPPEPGQFEAPWQAQLFAVTVALAEAGALDWSDWSARFGAARANVPRDDASDYYDHWLQTLEEILVERGVVSAGTLGDLTAAWARAAAATPHGSELLLENDPGP